MERAFLVHGLVFQSVVAPNGKIINLDGLWPGRRHNARILVDIHLFESLAKKCPHWVRNENLILYGDPLYPVSKYLEVPFRRKIFELFEEQEVLTAT